MTDFHWLVHTKWNQTLINLAGYTFVYLRFCINMAALWLLWKLYFHFNRVLFLSSYIDIKWQVNTGTINRVQVLAPFSEPTCTRVAVWLWPGSNTTIWHHWEHLHLFLTRIAAMEKFFFVLTFSTLLEFVILLRWKVRIGHFQSRVYHSGC